MMWPYAVDGWTWIWMTLMMVLFWGGVGLLAVWAFRSVSRGHQADGGALDILRRRLASGEITAEEFEKTRKILGA